MATRSVLLVVTFMFLWLYPLVVGRAIGVYHGQNARTEGWTGSRNVDHGQ